LLCFLLKTQFNIDTILIHFLKKNKNVLGKKKKTHNYQNEWLNVWELFFICEVFLSILYRPMIIMIFLLSFFDWSKLRKETKIKKNKKKIKNKKW